MTSDLLRMDYINSLPQPFVARMFGGAEWEVADIDVETGLMRILVCGKIQPTHIGEVSHFRDMDGAVHSADSFYCESEGE